VSKKEGPIKVFLTLATNAWRQKDYENGLKLTQAGLRLKPQDTRLKASLILRAGSIYAEMGKPDSAIKQFKKAISIDPTFSLPHYNLGVVYDRQKKYVAAEKEYKKAIRLDPNDRRFHYNLWTVYNKQGKYFEAKKEHKEVGRLSPCGNQETFIPSELHSLLIESDEPPMKILAAHFKSLNGELPILGGWGYCKADACIIGKYDPSVDRERYFDEMGIENIFVEQRIYYEMIISQPEGGKFFDIRWNLQKRKSFKDEDRIFDQLSFEITAFFEPDWEDLQNHGNTHFDAKAQKKKHQKKIIQFDREFWFDVTNCWDFSGTTVLECTVDGDYLKYGLINNFFDSRSEYLHFLLHLKVLKKATSDRKCIASLSTKDDYCKYELIWKGECSILEYVKFFRATQENCNQFNKGCAEMARRLHIYLETGDINQVSCTPPAFGYLSCEWNNEILFMPADSSYIEKSEDNVVISTGKLQKLMNKGEQTGSLSFAEINDAINLKSFSVNRIKDFTRILKEELGIKIINK
jgi:tetratricopeptide (TPR) repeat protein